MRYFSTGEVAKKLGLSLRTLRYYDQIGLAVPTIKNDSGKRYYTQDDLLLLEKIILLKSTSMSLKDIQKVIHQVTIKKILTVHKEQLKIQLNQLQQSLQHTNTLLNILKLEGSLQWEQLLPLFSEEEHNGRQERKKVVLQHLFTEEEQAILAENLPKMEEDPDQLTQWINLVKRIELCLEEGKAPDSQAGQLIAEDLVLLSKKIFGDNKQLADKFWEARKSEATASDLNLYPVKQEVIEFLEKVLGVRDA
ncbi:DNA-binding transcriptional regulator, MerR family [Evansella caseinilytica]|uniref:DNA-binding transcriptional regulator, MerR family n=1 Tax=Evansella caseinilytica TaxID=1503961 RepID=A0A1H3ICW4_9BACI|nr:MerR family transcriptional regulator [Evansella caseinilytica]SDY25546.1 DNA-binding transcriptional regulator, MerR family [Evansella caseinilytica]